MTTEGVADRIEPHLLGESGDYVIKTFSVTDMPDSLDWRTSGAVTEIQD